MEQHANMIVVQSDPKTPDACALLMADDLGARYPDLTDISWVEESHPADEHSAEPHSFLRFTFDDAQIVV